MLPALWVERHDLGVNRIIQSPLRAHWRPGCFPAQCAAAGWQLHDLPEPLENPAVRPGIHPQPSSLSAEWAVAGLLVGPWCWAVHEEELGQRHGAHGACTSGSFGAAWHGEIPHSKVRWHSTRGLKEHRAQLHGVTCMSGAPPDAPPRVPVAEAHRSADLCEASEHSQAVDACPSCSSGGEAWIGHP